VTVSQRSLHSDATAALPQSGRSCQPAPRRLEGGRYSIPAKNLKMIAGLLALWRDEITHYRRRGLNQAADLTESHAADLEAAVREYRLATLTLTEAATATGLKYDTIQGKVASGEIPNAGRRGSPRVRRCDLLSDEVLFARLAGR
jgi:hypothetical protein